MPVSAESLLPDSWRQEDLSIVYATAIAAAAGVAWDSPRRDVNSCDVRFYARDDEHEDGPQLMVQLKCTWDGLREVGSDPDNWRFSLKELNYRHLSATRTHPPRILVVVRCPRDFADWVSHSPEEILVRSSAWWTSLRGADPFPEGQETTSVLVPKSQVFDATALTANMRSCP